MDVLPWRAAGEGSTVLLIHGSGPDASWWEPVRAALERDHHVIVYDRRGFGSAAAPVSNWEVHAADALSILNEAGSGPATLVGHSAGCVVAATVAVRRRAAVDRLVLLDPALYLRRHLTPGFAAAYVRTALVRRTRGDEAGAATFLRWAFRYRNGGSAWDRPDYPPTRRRAMLANAPGIFADMAAGDRPHLPLRELTTLSIPVKILLGERSQRLYRRVAEGLATRLATAELSVLSGSAHDMTFDQPAELGASLARLLGD